MKAKLKISIILILILTTVIGIVLPSVNFADIGWTPYTVTESGWYKFDNGSERAYVAVDDDNGNMELIQYVKISPSESENDTYESYYKLYKGDTIYLRSDMLNENTTFEVYQSDSMGRREQSQRANQVKFQTKVSSNTGNSTTQTEPSQETNNQTSFPQEPNSGNNNNQQHGEGRIDTWIEKEIPEEFGDWYFVFQYKNENGVWVEIGQNAPSDIVQIKTDNGWVDIRLLVGPPYQAIQLSEGTKYRYLPFDDAYELKVGGSENEEFAASSEVNMFINADPDNIEETAEKIEIKAEPTPTPTLFEQLEKVIASVVRGAAKALVKLINLAVADKPEGITIDDIIFNHYEPTKLLYFDNPPKDTLIGEIVDGIGNWSQIFTQIAITGYLTVLLCMGLLILLKSTASRAADYKRYAIDWVIGVGLLFFFPFIVKYSIQINDALVEQIEAGKTEAAKAATSSNTSKKAELNVKVDATVSDKIKFGNAMDEPAFDESNTNYMAIMERRAEKSGRLSYAIVYMVMAWQLLMLVIVYYRRLFMVGFLLVLFPLVALTYAVDKIKDGQSQAFDRWGKEILLNIFLQTFHAIIYIFALNASFVGDKQSDWIIMLMGVTFLFKGEEIIKGIFGQKAESVKSLTNTALMTAAVYGAVAKGAGKLKDNFIGANSHLGRGWRARRDARTYGLMAENFDTLASTGAEYTPPPVTALSHAPTTMDEDAERLGYAIQIVNNRGKANDAIVAASIGFIQDYKGPHADMLADLNINVNKLTELQRIKEGAIRQLNAGVDKATIEQNIRLELETTFEAKDVDKMQQVLYRQMSNTARKSNHLPRNTDRDLVKQELKDARQRRKDINDSYKFAGQDGKINIKDQNKIDDLLYNTYGTTTNSTEQKEMAKAIMIVSERANRKYSAKQQVEAMDYIMKHKNNDSNYRRMIETLDQDVDEMNLVLANNVMNRANRGKGVSEKTKDWAKDTISYYMNEKNPLNDELEEINVLSLYKDEPLAVIGQDNTEKIIDRVIEARDFQNFHEQHLLSDFAKSHVVEEKPRAPLLDGMTRDELYEMADAKREESNEEIARAGLETAGAMLAIPIGTAAGIAFAESDKGPIVEGIAGGFAGAVAGDQAVANVMGGTKVKEYKMRNPYTGEDETVKLKVGGAFSEHIRSFNDPVLPDNVRGSIKEQFIKTAAAKRKKEEAERQKKMK